MSVGVAVKRQAFECKLLPLPLEGEFTLDEGCTSVLDLIGPVYLFVSLVTYQVTAFLTEYYSKVSVKPTYAKWER